MSDPLFLCRQMKARAQGGPLTRDEAAYYVDLTREDVWVDDPENPPGYDWDGALVVGGAQLNVADEARTLLVRLGREQLPSLFVFPRDADLAASTMPPSFLFEVADRAALAAAYRRRGFENDAAQFVAGLFDADPAVVEHVVAIIDEALHKPRHIEGWPAHPRAQQIVAIVNGDWSRVDSLDLSFKMLGAQQLAGFLDAHPAQRATLLAAILRRFDALPAGSRYADTERLTVFAPDADAFVRVLAELRARGSAASEAVPFVERHPAWLSDVIAALSLRTDQHEAFGVKKLLLLDPRAFGRAFPASRMDALRKCLRCLPSATEADQLLALTRAP